jgi:bifunctional ADP-heptose synthase (sugar kinase/adenylyltransferase)
MAWPLTVERLEELVAHFPQLTIGLLGDLFLDRYLEVDCECREWSIETGLEAYQIDRIRNSPGALGTVINNLAALGVGHIMPVTVVGDDGHGYDLMKALTGLPVDTTGILRRADRLTPTYTKPICRAPQDNWRELNRLDIRSRTQLSEAAHQQLAKTLTALFPQCDGWVVLDQVPEPDQGVVDQRMRRVLEQLTAEDPAKLLLVDSRQQLQQFRCGALKGNRSEFVGGDGAEIDVQSERLVAAVQQSSRRTGRPAFCTVGDRGMLVAWPDGRVQPVDGFAVSGPIDIVGAGDAATSGLVTALLAGGNEVEAATVGNLAASITVQQIGTTGVATRQQILRRLADTNLSQ